jgi:large subunit ribosomal protein L22
MVGRTLAKVTPRDSATARATFLSIPPRKMRLVGDLVKGMPVDKALNILNFTPRIAAVHMAKTLKAAVANMLSVEGTSNLHPEDLFIARIVVDEAPTAKRIKFQSMGRVFRIRKRYCHLSIFLDATREAAAEAATRTKPAKGKTEADATKAPKKTASAKKKAAAKAKSRVPGAGKKSGSKVKGFSKRASKTTAKVTKSTKDR